MGTLATNCMNSSHSNFSPYFIPFFQSTDQIASRIILRVSAHLSLLHDILDLLVFPLQLLVCRGQVSEPPLVLVVPGHGHTLSGF